MIREISCKSAQCIHNFAGRCARDGVQVEEYLGEYGNIPYCNSFATARCMDALKKYGGPYVIGQGAGHFQTEFADSFDEYSDRIGCAVQSCMYYGDFRCNAETLGIDEPTEPGSTLCPCLTYVPK